MPVDCIKAFGRQNTDSYFEWNYPQGQRTLMKRMLSILRDHGGKMHYNDFQREYKRRYGEHG